jgi:hypothetical protein
MYVSTAAADAHIPCADMLHLPIYHVGQLHGDVWNGLCVFVLQLYRTMLPCWSTPGYLPHVLHASMIYNDMVQSGHAVDNVSPVATLQCWPPGRSGVWRRRRRLWPPNNINATNCTFRDNRVEGQGGTLYLQGGATHLVSSTITSNFARQQGGGIAFINLCGTSSLACSLHLPPGTTVTNNSAQLGGYVFLSVPDSSSSVALREIEAAAPHAANTAVCSAGVSVAPTRLSVTPTSFRVPSSTGSSGVIKLMADVGQASTRVQAEFCDFSHNDSAYLSGSVEQSGGQGVAVFGSLRLLQASVDTTCCLRVS